MQKNAVLSNVLAAHRSKRNIDFDSLNTASAPRPLLFSSDLDIFGLSDKIVELCIIVVPRVRDYHEPQRASNQRTECYRAIARTISAYRQISIF